MKNLFKMMGIIALGHRVIPRRGVSDGFFIQDATFLHVLATFLYVFFASHFLRLIIIGGRFL